ncbi:MAG TPA: SpoIIE family protein phosphatase [Streptosporangiaceae bacterium]|nr:SpoIIE family protein phosphatase [Streptosporangiaceae bacterium]
MVRDEALALVPFIERLRNELMSLRRWIPAQLVIEQAKGLLAERHGCGIDEAHAHLLELAADSGADPAVTAAALLIAVRPPGPGDDAGRGDDPGDADHSGRVHDAGAGDRPDDDDGEFTCLAARLGQAQRLGNLGWSEWDLVTGAARWSDQLYVIFDSDPSAPPADLDTFLTWVIPEDLPIVRHLLRRLFSRGQPVDTEFRIRRGRRDGPAGGGRRRDDTRHLRVVAEPVLDAFGQPVRVRCVFQDVTHRRRAERSLAASRRQVERQRRVIEEERHIVVELQRAILPLPRGIVRKPGLEAAVRYLPAGNSARVGGDWYEATSIDDAEVFLAIGDVSGHGMSAVAAMARLRNALSGLAFTGAAPDALLGWLNRLVLHWPPVLTATALTGRFDPGTRTLTWAQAGHLPPVLVRDGRPRLLAVPEGVLLGACLHPVFATRTTRLAPGDLLMLYTDGLIERRDRDIDEGFGLLLDALAGRAAGEPDQIIDHVLAALGAANPIDDTCLLVCRIH